MGWRVWKLKNPTDIFKRWLEMSILCYPVIMNDLGILKKWKVSLWRGQVKSLIWQSVREWRHSLVNLTTGRTKQKEIDKFILISTKLGWLIPVRKDWQGHILYLIFCGFFFSCQWDGLNNCCILQTNTCFTFVILHKSREMPKGFDLSDGWCSFKNLWSRQFFFAFSFVPSLNILFLPILQINS